MMRKKMRFYFLFLLLLSCLEVSAQSIDGQFKSYSHYPRELKKKHSRAFARSYPKLCTTKQNRILRYSKAQQQKRKSGLLSRFVWGIEGALKYTSLDNPYSYAANIFLGRSYLKNIFGGNIGYDGDYGFGERFSLELDYRRKLKLFPFDSFVGLQGGVTFSNLRFEEQGYTSELRWGVKRAIFIISIGAQYTITNQDVTPRWIDRQANKNYNFTTNQLIGVFRLGIQI